MLSGYQPDPGGETATRGERVPIPDLGDQGGGDDRADTGYFFQPSAFFARSVPGMDVLLDVSDLGRDRGILPSKNMEAPARCRRDAIVLLIGNELEQFGRAFAAFRRDNAELRQMSADRIRQHRALADEKLSAAM